MSLDQRLHKDPPQGPSDASNLYGWDWSSTTHDGGKAAVRDLLGALDPAVVLPGPGIQGWSRGLEAFDREGYKLATVYHGGREGVHVVSTSTVADTARSTIVGMHDARTARVDTRVDTLAPFAELVDVLGRAAQRYGSQITYMQKVAGRDQVSEGRTVYLGSPKSAIRVRLYEKWLQAPGEYVEGVNRVEVQLRPASKVKDRVSGWSRAETFCASKVTRELAAELGAELLPTVSLHVARPVPELEQTLAAMGKQYRRPVDRFLQATGGDLDTVLDYLLGRSDRP